MIKRTLYLGTPAYLHVRLDQLHIRPPLAADGSQPDGYQLPIGDLGVLVLDHPQITLTHALVQAMLKANVAIISCDEKHHPAGQLLPLCGNVLQHERYQAQIAASLPLKKQLWAQVIEAKLLGQAAALRLMNLGETAPLVRFAKLIRSGDPDNLEGRGAAYYWDKVMSSYQVTRDPDGEWPNAAYNYAYALVRATMARALVGAGLLPTLGIHHHNRYNAFCLADDMIEPLRPVADLLVGHSLDRIEEPEGFILTRPWKAALLKLPSIDVRLGTETSPVMVACQRMASSLVRCLEGRSRKLLLPMPLPIKE